MWLGFKVLQYQELFDYNQIPSVLLAQKVHIPSYLEHH